MNEINSKAEDNFQNYRIRFKSVKCQSDNKTVITKYCYLKTVSRKVVTFNFGLKFLVPYTRPIYSHTIFYYRYHNDVMEQFSVKLLTPKNLKLVQLLTDMIKSKAPHLIHKYPFEGDCELKNFTTDLDFVDKATMLCPEGTYRLDVSLFFNGSATFNFSGSAEVKSPLKESFG